MVRKVIVIGLLLVCQSYSSVKIYQSLNPGIKIGYCWGKNSGWVWGPEISYVGWNMNSFFFGPVCGATFHFQHSVQSSYYLEAECGSVFAGGVALGVEVDKGISGRARFFIGEGGYLSGKINFGKPGFELCGTAKYPVFITQPKDMYEWLGI